MDKKIIMTGLLSLSLGGLLMSTMFQPVEARYGANRMINAGTLQAEVVSATELANLDEILSVLIIDEYNARATYTAFVEKFGEVSPFVHLINAETSHIKALTRLFDAYGLDVPSDNANVSALPKTLQEAYEIGEQAEVTNIKLYETYLEQDLPENVEQVFNNLKNASETHLETFIAYEEGKTIDDCVPTENLKNRQNKRNS